MLRSGQMRDYVGVNAQAAGSTSLSKEADVWVEMRSISGKERNDMGIQDAEVSHRAWMRHVSFPTLTSSHILTSLSGTEYAITSIRRIGPKKDEWELVLKEDLRNG